MNEELYRREGRRFVNNVGKYYQEDGSFVDECTPKSIGLCISSNNKEHTVMTLKDEFVRNYEARMKPLPTFDEMFIAFLKFEEELNLKRSDHYKIMLNSYIGWFCFKGNSGIAGTVIMRGSNLRRARFVIKIKN